MVGGEKNIPSEKIKIKICITKNPNQIFLCKWHLKIQSIPDVAH